VRRRQADASAAARELGFKCRVSMEEGLRLTVDWLRSLA
jgi:nucleoside-diphosphate-sugar epimerase